MLSTSTGIIFFLGEHDTSGERGGGEMIQTVTSHLHSQYQKLNHSKLNMPTGDGGEKPLTHYRVDRVELSVPAWRATSMAQDLLDHITHSYASHTSDASSRRLRCFYVAAKEGLDRGFASLPRDSATDPLMQIAYEQKVKELKDRYHHRGEPREKVDLVSVGVRWAPVEVQTARKVQDSYARYESAFPGAGLYGHPSQTLGRMDRAKAGSSPSALMANGTRRLALLLALIGASSLFLVMKLALT